MSDTQTEPTAAEKAAAKRQADEDRKEAAEKLADLKTYAESVALQALVDTVRTDPGTGNDNRGTAAVNILNYLGSN